VTDAANPYLAPEAPIAERPPEVRRSTVDTTISLLCRVVGVILGLVAGSVVGLFIVKSIRFGWKGELLPATGARFMIILGLIILSTGAYLVAGRWVGADRRRPGLILCLAGIGMTYLAAWLFTWK
jgi:hypothetical protein